MRKRPKPMKQLMRLKEWLKNKRWKKQRGQLKILKQPVKLHYMILLMVIMCTRMMNKISMIQDYTHWKRISIMILPKSQPFWRRLKRLPNIIYMKLRKKLSSKQNLKRSWKRSKTQLNSSTMESKGACSTRRTEFKWFKKNKNHLKPHPRWTISIW